MVLRAVGAGGFGGRGVAVNGHFAQMEDLVGQDSAGEIAEAEIIGFNAAVCGLGGNAVLLGGFERAHGNQRHGGEKNEIGKAVRFAAESAKLKTARFPPAPTARAATPAKASTRPRCPLR